MSVAEKKARIAKENEGLKPPAHLSDIDALEAIYFGIASLKIERLNELQAAGLIHPMAHESEMPAINETGYRLLKGAGRI